MRLIPLLLMACMNPLGPALALDLGPEVSSFAYAATHNVDGFPTAFQISVEPPNGVSNTSTMALCGMAYSVAVENHLPADFFISLIQQESGFKTQAVSPAGAEGIAQFMPGTAADVGLANPFDPMESLIASGKLLAQLVRQFGNLGLAAAAYNAGPRRVQDWISRRRRLPIETQQYVYRITAHTVDEWVGQNQNDKESVLLNSSCATFPSPGPPVAERTVQAKEPESIGGNITSLFVKRGRSGESGRSVVRHAMPQPSRFAIGRPVPPSILASERAVLARYKRADG